MKTRSENHCAATIGKLRHLLSSSAIVAGSMLALALPAAAGTVYFDDFTTPGSAKGGPYTSSIDGTATTTGGGAWLAGVEAGGWGQTGDGRATPTSSNFLAFTPDPGRIYTVQATIDTTPLGGADPGGTNSWFTLGFTSSQHNWNGVDGSTIDTANLVRWNSNQVATITYTVSGATLVTNGIQYVGWITDRAGTVNLTPSNEQVKITNFSLISGVANPTVTYDGNGSDNAAPTDGSSPYAHSATVTVLGAGTMTRSGFNFAGWNTASDGSGTDYSPTATFTIYDNTTLYAKWLSTALVTLTYDGNGSTGGSAPVDASSPYTSGSTATVLAPGSLTRKSYSFANWNTVADGSGTSYSPSDTFTINANTTLYARWTPGPDYVWDNAAATDAWNTADANWSGATWANSATNNAFFTSVGGSISLNPGILAGAVNVGNTGANFASLDLSGGDLTATTLTVQGLVTNPGNYAANPTLSVDSTVTISGDAAIGRANLNISGGTFTANRIISAPASADWARLVVSGGIVTATNGVDGSVNTTATFAIDLNGGELLAPSIKVADREVGTNNDAWLTFNGGTLKAIGADNPDFITTYGGGQTTFVDVGGAIIDTNGLNIGLLVNMVRSGASTGGLTKNGTGTLTLGGSVYNYRGNTVVNDGALNVSSGSAMEFNPTTNGTNNSVSAGSTTATLSFLGQVYLDLSAADATDGNSWNLFDVGSFSTAPVLTPTLVNSTAGAFTNSSGTWTLVDGDNTWTFVQSTGVLSLAVVTATPYETWGSPYGLTTGSEGGDLDNDGLTNFQEFAFGLIPNSGSSVNPITVQLSKTTGQFNYQRLNGSGLTYTIWTSPDLVTWTEDTGATASQNVTTGTPNDSVQVTLTGPLPADKLFVRVKAQ
jgi:autotransporter-associated beta strand protein